MQSFQVTGIFYSTQSTPRCQRFIYFKFFSSFFPAAYIFFTKSYLKVILTSSVFWVTFSFRYAISTAPREHFRLVWTQKSFCHKGVRFTRNWERAKKSSPKPKIQNSWRIQECLCNVVTYVNYTVITQFSSGFYNYNTKKLIKEIGICNAMLITTWLEYADGCFAFMAMGKLLSAKMSPDQPFHPPLTAEPHFVPAPSIPRCLSATPSSGSEPRPLLPQALDLRQSRALIQQRQPQAEPRKGGDIYPLSLPFTFNEELLPG